MIAESLFIPSRNEEDPIYLSSNRSREYKPASEEKNMNRIDAEKMLIAKAEELYSLYKKYNPNGDHLSIGISDDFVTINNTYWRDDKMRPIDVIKRDGNILSRDHY